MAIEELRGQIEHFCGLGDHVIDQARRRVLFGEQVATDEKIYSIFEPHTDLIKRGKVRTPVEFGHKVLPRRKREGLITHDEVLKGNPPDEVHGIFPPASPASVWPGSRAGWLGSPGFFSEQELGIGFKHAGVKLVCIPQRGGKENTATPSVREQRGIQERSALSRRHRGRISVLFRGRGMKRCLAEGRERFEFWVGAAVLANNLMRSAKKKGTTDGSVASQTKKLLDRHAGPLPADQNGRGSTCLELKVGCQATPSPSSKITRPKLANAGLSCHFVPNPSK